MQTCRRGKQFCPQISSNIDSTLDLFIFLLFSFFSLYTVFCLFTVFYFYSHTSIKFIFQHFKQEVVIMASFIDSTYLLHLYSRKLDCSVLLLLRISDFNSIPARYLQFINVLAGAAGYVHLAEILLHRKLCLTCSDDNPFQILTFNILVSFVMRGWSMQMNI